MKVSVKDNKLTFPPSVAKGRYEYYELSENLGMLCADVMLMDDMPVSYTHLTLPTIRLTC